MSLQVVPGAQPLQPAQQSEAVLASGQTPVPSPASLHTPPPAALLSTLAQTAA
eukprot:CAMPEP_0115735710 /NCGR_PEP_ID=MMETSP0272-20121206/86870_1 /TAXON_ID=71861 /ORGANISM="Scrippsiella trochoidea, Strain CCMP3099" /LENGTH=52 /DNA_ID=CAMNT_0003179845 /DNA_START=255 /DNA_END=409 /DNA_ORIENTATION=-